MKTINIALGLLLLLIFVGCGGTSSTSTNSGIKEEKIDYKSKFINTKSCNQIIDKSFFVICYDYKLKAAKSVAYHLDGDLMAEKIDKRPSFYREPTLEKRYQILTTDYTNSGYDRGHLAPDAAFDWSDVSLKSVYTLANIIPQAPQVNKHMWSKVETLARNKAVELGDLDVVNVVEYSKYHKSIGKNKMAVSKNFYKILYNDNKGYKACFKYSNRLNTSSRNDTVEKHRVDCNTINY